MVPRLLAATARHSANVSIEMQAIFSTFKFSSINFIEIKWRYIETNNCK